LFFFFFFSYTIQIRSVAKNQNQICFYALPFFTTYTPIFRIENKRNEVLELFSNKEQKILTNVLERYKSMFFNCFFFPFSTLNICSLLVFFFFVQFSLEIKFFLGTYGSRFFFPLFFKRFSI
jgi:hypothetical protein